MAIQLFIKENKFKLLHRLILIGIILLSSLFFTSCFGTKIDIVVSPELSTNKSIRIAVLDFEYEAEGNIASIFYGAGSSKNAGTMIADLLAEEMMSIPNVVVIERSKLKAILREKELTVSGILESNELDEIAKLAGIDALVTGSVGSASGANILGAYQESTAAFQARCIRASDGIILWSGSIVSTIYTHNSTRTLRSAAKKFGEELKDKLK